MSIPEYFSKSCLVELSLLWPAQTLGGGVAMISPYIYLWAPWGNVILHL